MSTEPTAPALVDALLAEIGALNPLTHSASGWPECYFCHAALACPDCSPAEGPYAAALAGSQPHKETCIWMRAQAPAPMVLTEGERERIARALYAINRAPAEDARRAALWDGWDERMMMDQQSRYLERADRFLAVFGAAISSPTDPAPAAEGESSRLDSLNSRVGGIIIAALSGRDERYIYRQDGQRYTRWGLVQEDIDALLDEVVGPVALALGRFASSAPAQAVAREDYSYMRERIVDWFGPSDFRAARQALGLGPPSDDEERDVSALQPAPSLPMGETDATADLLERFAAALLAKLRAAEAKYGYDGNWLRTGWMDECRAELLRHVAKGDPRDVAAYCAFLWHHGESTAPTLPMGESGEVERAGVEAPRWVDGYGCSVCDNADDPCPACFRLAEVERALAVVTTELRNLRPGLDREHLHRGVQREKVDDALRIAAATLGESAPAHPDATR